MAIIKTYTKPEAIRTAVMAALMQIKAIALESSNGKCPLNEMRAGKSTGRKILAWAQIEHLAPECFRGPRSDQWIWLLADELGVEISGGKSNTGPLTATLTKKEMAR